MDGKWFTFADSAYAFSQLCSFLQLFNVFLYVVLKQLASKYVDRCMQYIYTACSTLP